MQQFIYLHSELFTLAAQQIYNITFFLLRPEPNQTKNQNTQPHQSQKKALTKQTKPKNKKKSYSTSKDS